MRFWSSRRPKHAPAVLFSPGCWGVSRHALGFVRACVLLFGAELMSDLLGLGYLESRICSTISMRFSRSGLLSLNPRIAKHARQPDGSSMCLLEFCDRDIAATAGC